MTYEKHFTCFSHFSEPVVLSFYPFEFWPFPFFNIEYKNLNKKNLFPLYLSSSSSARPLSTECRLYSLSIISIRHPWCLHLSLSHEPPSLESLNYLSRAVATCWPCLPLAPLPHPSHSQSQFDWPFVGMI
jgi:hypothetical protein